MPLVIFAILEFVQVTWIGNMVVISIVPSNLDDVLLSLRTQWLHRIIKSSCLQIPPKLTSDIKFMAAAALV